jgi:uncharacterized protein YjbI with pentapeptide repeats
LSPAQLYSTASYQAHDLTGISLEGGFPGINLATQNLTNADFHDATLTDANLSQANLTHANFFSDYYVGANLTGADLSHANLTNANFGGFSDEFFGNFDGANLTNANLRGADARGANLEYAIFTGAITSNLIRPNGHIAGLNLTVGASLTVRDYEGNPTAFPPTGPLPIVVDQNFTMDATGTLRLVFDADPWDSTISFAPGIAVTLGGGMLDLGFAAGVDLAAQAGHTFDLFDWSGVTRSGSFTVANSGAWDLSQLYTTGEVTFGVAPTWNVNANGNWSSAANWNSGGVPNGIDAIASFGTVITSTRTVTVDTPRTVGVMSFSSPVGYTIAGGSTITMDVSSGQAAINVTAGSHVISAPLTLNKDTTITSSAGAGVAITGAVSASGRTITKAGAGWVQFENVRATGLNVTAGSAKISPKPAANSLSGTSVLQSLSIAAGASLDLTNNSLVIDYPGTAGFLATETRQSLADGRLVSTSSTSTRRLGYADNAITGLAVFSGQSVDPSSMLIKFTYAGDANLDGQVDIADLGSLATNWQQSAVWTGGDFNYDGMVNVADLGLLATNWQAGVSAPMGPSLADALAQFHLPTSVPEPAAMALLAFALAHFVRPRRTENRDRTTLQSQ